MSRLARLTGLMTIKPPPLSGTLYLLSAGLVLLGGYLDLTEEPFRAESGGKVGPEHLDGHLAMMLEILGQVDGCHAAATDLAVNTVTVGEGGV